MAHTIQFILGDYPAPCRSVGGSPAVDPQSTVGVRGRLSALLWTRVAPHIGARPRITALQDLLIQFAHYCVVTRLAGDTGQTSSLRGRSAPRGPTAEARPSSIKVAEAECLNLLYTSSWIRDLFTACSLGLIVDI
ncbi:hypothetical protein VTG60DRAFT_4530 [Thermothelomyces hinnuleus]